MPNPLMLSQLLHHDFNANDYILVLKSASQTNKKRIYDVDDRIFRIGTLIPNCEWKYNNLIQIVKDVSVLDLLKGKKPKIEINNEWQIIAEVDPAIFYTKEGKVPNEYVLDILHKPISKQEELFMQIYSKHIAELVTYEEAKRQLLDLFANEYELLNET